MKKNQRQIQCSAIDCNEEEVMRNVILIRLGTLTKFTQEDLKAMQAIDIDLDLLDTQRDFIRRQASRGIEGEELYWDGVMNLLDAISDQALPAGRDVVEYADDYQCPDCMKVFRKHELRVKVDPEGMPGQMAELLCPICGTKLG
jgi:hypothetical protein